MRRKSMRMVKDFVIERLPANTSEEAADLFQWVFYLPWFAERTNFLVQARPLANALTTLRQVSCRKDANAQDVLFAWRVLYDVAGPWLTGQFIASGAWTIFVRDPQSSRDTASLATLWEGDGRAVVCRVQFVKDEPVDMKFSIVEDVADGQGGPF